MSPKFQLNWMKIKSRKLLKQLYIHDCSVHQTGPGEVRFSEKFTLIRVRMDCDKQWIPSAFSL